MVNVVNMSVNVDGATLANWSCNFSHSYKEYTMVAVYQKGRWAYSLTEVASNEIVATLVVNSVRRQRTAVASLLLNVGMDYATASDMVGYMYDKIKGCLEQLNPLFM